MTENTGQQAPQGQYDGYYKYDQAVAKGYDASREVQEHWAWEDDYVEVYTASREITSLLDLPVGTGRFFPHYKNVRRVTGVDISDAMLAEAKKKVGILPPTVQVQIEKGDVFGLRFTNGEFDAVLVFRLFHLIPKESVEPAVKELCRVAGKELVIQTYVPFRERKSPIKKLASVFSKKKETPKITSPPREKKSQTPWSHIAAYYHEQSFFDDLFARNGFPMASSKVLGIYENREVRVSIYSKQT